MFENFLRPSGKSRLDKIHRELGYAGSVEMYFLEQYDPDVVFLCDRGFRRSHDAAIDLQENFQIPALALARGLQGLSTTPRETREAFYKDRKGKTLFGILIDTSQEQETHAPIIAELINAVGEENVIVTNNHAEVVQEYLRRK